MVCVRENRGGLDHSEAFMNRSIHLGIKVNVSVHLPAASQVRGSGSTTKCPLITPGDVLPSRM